MLKIKSFVCNPVAENTYVVWDDESLEGAVIDAGCFSQEEKMRVQTFITKEQLTIKYLLSTHLHFDHIFSNRFIAETFHVGLSAHRDDTFLLDNFARQTALFGLDAPEAALPVDTYIDETDTISIGQYDFSILHIPGHSPGGIVFYCAKAGVAFSGDVLFRDSIGRTDLWGGNHEALVTGIREKLFTLPDSTVVYPGHGPQTTIGYEKTHNPYVY